MKPTLPAVAVLSIALIAAGCSSQSGASPAASKGGGVSGVMMAENKKHPLAKYLELVGFRLSEKGQGKLTVKLGVVNHSDADISDLGLQIGLKPVNAKPDEAPFCTLAVKIPALGPQEIASATGECTTTLRVYELPDWQFIRGTFEITAPAP
jgi:hypothetical protein